MDGEKDIFDSALKVNEGIEQPSIVNEHFLKNLPKRKPQLTAEEYADGIVGGNRTLLSQAITLIESTLPKHEELAQSVLEMCLPHTGKSVRIGITGVPGVGKSTFIEAFGKYLTNGGHKVAVLAIDPSSQRSKGSILGDKTRMEELSQDLNAFIRPSPSAGSLGGVARKTRETVLLCEAAGFDVIIIETVGVGQSETAVHSMVDFFLLLMLSGAGDELQGIKRGIMEMADAILINKADGDNKQRALLAKAEYQNALHLFPPTESGWYPKAETCSAYTREGIDKVWGMIDEYLMMVKENGYFHKRRKYQARRIMIETIENELLEHFYQTKGVQKAIADYGKAIEADQISSYVAAHRLLELYLKK